MRTIGAFAAKTHLSELLDQVSAGETLAITKHGTIVAFLVPANTKPSLTIAEAVVGINALRKKIAKRGVKLRLADIQAMKEEGRK